MRSLLARRSMLLTAMAAAGLGLLALPPASASASSPARTADTAAGSHGTHGPAVVVVPQHPGPPGVPTARHPLLVKVRGYTRAGQPVLSAGTGGPGGYTATELHDYLRLRGTGAGQTVAIVDAFDNPYAAGDLTAYSQQFGLPLPCPVKHGRVQPVRGCFSFRVVHPFGIGGLDTGWALEESLDIEMVHAIAPRAAIVLVEAHDNLSRPMFSALSYAAGLHPTVISNSWSFGGEFAGEASDDRYCQLNAAVCTFATGDSGHPGGYPAYNPAVIAVGGTTLNLTASGAVQSETAWNGSGGGVSKYEPRPAFQDNEDPYAGRGVPDVSFDADPNTGVAVDSAVFGGWVEVGGTSVAAPAWAAILAAADQLRRADGKAALTSAGYEAQQALYGLATGRNDQPLYDITTGSNGTCGAVCAAGPGYDFVTGLGSPRSGIDTALAAAP